MKQKKSDEHLFPIVGIGASAGGLAAMKQLLENLPEKPGLGFVIVQHLAPDQESLLPEILSRHTKMEVKKVQNGTKVKPDNVYVMPAGKMMTISQGTLNLESKTFSLKPINKFLESLAVDWKIKSIGVVLSGTGTDGTEGLKAIKNEGGITFVQDPKTAQYKDMPRNAILAGTVDYSLSPKVIAEELMNIANHPKISRQKIVDIEESTKEELTSNQKIFTLLRAVFGVNFANYKKSTTNRRINRRMVLNKIRDRKNYVDFLRENKEELQSLFDDLLIGVTSFFREPNTFAILKEKVFPKLVEENHKKETIRVWVPGCSTGEEVFSIAIAIEEYLEEKNIVNKQIQIFGTDANNKFIEKARKAIYPKTIEDNVSEKRLTRFFISVNGNYQVKKRIRDFCIFARHDLTIDPPFSNLDMIVCRNLLIYFESRLQEKIIPILHYGLRENGYLVLGQSESIGKYTYLFKPLTKKGLVFQKKEAQPRVEFQLEKPILYNNSKSERPVKIDTLALLQHEMDDLLLSEYTPPSILLNNDFEVIIFRGDVHPFIGIDSGVASLKATKIVRKDLRPTLQTGLYKAKKNKKEILEIVLEKDEKQSKKVKIKIKPLTIPKNEEAFYLVVFEETTPKKLVSIDRKKFSSTIEMETAKDEQIKDLSDELASTKQTLQMIVEQQEATNEELRSSLEEAQSSNEELMSTNEELETTKEELQSANEELETLNDELKDRNQRLGELNSDLTNLMGVIDSAVILVDNEFKIRRFTDSAENLLKIIPTDMNHLITDIRFPIPIRDLKELLNKVVNNLEIIRKDIETEQGKWYQMRIKPYLTEDKKIGGAIISLVDITELKKLEEENQSYTDDLEQKVKEQTSQLIESENLATIGKTAGMVGHDIRNPLQAIEGELYLAKKEIDKMPDSDQKYIMEQSLKTIQNRLFYINKIVVDLQDFAKNLKPNIEKINFHEIVKKQLHELSIPENVKVRVSIETNFPELNLDRSYLERILTNLLMNSFQAMPDGGEITISAILRDNNALMSIKDTGIGISKSSQKKIFTPLFTTKSKGQGFGLAVVKKLTEAMNGSISFESEVDKGSQFTLEFPLERKKE